MHCCLYLQNDQDAGLPSHNIEDMLLTFAVAMQEGQFGLGRQIKVQTVEAALQAVSQMCVLIGYSNPRCASPAQHALNLPIACLIKKFGDEDQPPQPKFAIPVLTICAIATKYTFRFHQQAVAGMTVIALFTFFGWVIHHPMQTTDKTHNPASEM